jgi:hypothetical protein
MLCKQLLKVHSPQLETYISLIILRTRLIGSLKNKRCWFLKRGADLDQLLVEMSLCLRRNKG